MKLMPKINLAMLATLLACSSHVEKPSMITKRTIANFTTSLDDEKAVSNRMNKLIEGVFHSYLLGQTYLNDFDKQLDHDAKGAMDSEAYSKLMVIRTFVDQYEEEINNSYLDLVVITGSSDYSDIQRANAQKALDIIGNFVAGVPSDKISIDENLKPMVLSNLMEKQTSLYDQLDLLSELQDYQNNQQMKDALHKNKVLLRASRMNENKMLKTYDVDASVLKATIAQESKRPEFKAFEKNVKEQAKELKKFMQELKGGRSTSSDIIFASSGTAGNITGRGYPANTWSLTYDDGPAAKYAGTVLANLQAAKMKATFFELAHQVELFPQSAINYKNAGMDMACHSYTHANLPKVGPVQLEREITTAKHVIEQKLGITIKLFRLPYGAGVSNANIRAKIAANKMIHIFWNVDTLDWQDKNPQSILARALKQMKGNGNKGVILFHDIHPQSVAASKLLMDHFVANRANTKTCTVQEVVDQLNNQRATCGE